MKINFELFLTLLLASVPILFCEFCFVIIFSKSFLKFKTKWQTKYQEYLEKKKAEQEEQERELEAIVSPGNKILEYLSEKFTLVFWGSLGSGKTLLANVVAYYILKKQQLQDHKMRRQLFYTNPGYLEDLEKLQVQSKLNIYSEIELEDFDTGFNSFELWEYITQKKRTIENGIYFMDEIGTKFGKEKFQEGAIKDPEYRIAEKTVRFARQDANIKIIATEQDKDNIWKPIRDKGFTDIQCLGVSSWLTPKGLRVRKFKNFCLKCLPAWLTINMQEQLAISFGKLNKFKTILKSLLPAYFLLPKPYYVKKIKIAKAIKFKYTRIKVNFILDGGYQYLIFTNNDILKYNTRGHKEIYLNQFDENGNRRTNEKKEK